MASDDPRSSVLRVRRRIVQNLWLAVALCLLLAAAGGFVAYEEYTAPDTTTEQRTTATWTTDSEFTHRATIQESTRAFDRGTVLENRSAYLVSVAPELNGRHIFRHEGEAGQATVTTAVELVKRSVEPGDGGTEFWRVTDTLERTESTLAPGDTAETTFTVNVPRQRNETREIERELGGTPGQIEMYVQVTTRVSTRFEGEQLNRSRTDRLTITPTTSTYGVATNATGEQTEPLRTESVSVPAESNPARIYLGTAFAVLWLGVAAGLVYADRRDLLAVDPELVVAMETARERDRFDEWISTGRVPDPDDTDRVVTVDSLEGLVDVAIDSDRRVIEDTDGGQFVVLDGRTQYVFAAEEEQDDTIEPSAEATSEEADSDEEPD